MPTRRKDAELAGRVALARKRAGFDSMPALARAMGVSEQTMWRTESAGVVPGPNVMAKLTRALGVSEAWIRFGIGEGPRAAEAPAAVAEYLAGPLGRDASDDLAARLRQVDYAALGIAHVGVKDVHRVRELIEFNLAIGSKYGDGDGAK